MFYVAVYQFTFFLFLSIKFGKIKDNWTPLIAYFFFDKSCTLWYFCAEVYFTYVGLGSMWIIALLIYVVVDNQTEK